MARKTTTGEVAAAEAATPPLAVTNGVHVGLPLESYAVMWNGCVISHSKGLRMSCETALKTVLQATDKAISWES
jgi:hypothetical protein